MNKSGTKSKSKNNSKRTRIYSRTYLESAGLLPRIKRDILIEGSIPENVIIQDERIPKKRSITRSVSIRLSREDMAEIYSRALELSEKSI